MSFECCQGSGEEVALESLGLEEWAWPVLARHPLAHRFVPQCLWRLLGTTLSGDGEMDRSQTLSRQTESHTGNFYMM